MKFQKYPSLENHYQQKPVDYALEHRSTDTWVAREKIHGANFSIWYNGSIMKFASRNGFLQEFDNFFDWRTIRQRYEQSMKDLYVSIQRTDNLNDGYELAIFGEIAGKLASGRSIQREVFYGDVEFWAFDLMVNDGFIEELQLESTVIPHGFKCAPIIKIGNFLDVYNESNIFQSVIAVREDGEDNVCEGLVLKPNTPTFMPNGSRLAIKSKNDKFIEKHRAKKGKVNEQAVINNAFTDNDRELIMEMSTYITENRLRNVLSKFVGEPEKKDFPVILELFQEDIMDDFNKENEDVKYDNPNKVAIHFKKTSAGTLGKHFKSIITGQF